jgi:hypothetical protein
MKDFSVKFYSDIKNRGKAMANYPSEFTQDAAYQSHTSRLTELWSLPRPAQGLILIIIIIIIKH